MRVYVREPNVDRDASLLDWLHAPTTRAVAAVRLLIAGFVEPAATSPEVVRVSANVWRRDPPVGQRYGSGKSQDSHRTDSNELVHKRASGLRNGCAIASNMLIILMLKC